MSESPLLSKRLHRPFEGHLVGAGEKDLPVDLLALALITFGANSKHIKSGSPKANKLSHL